MKKVLTIAVRVAVVLIIVGSSITAAYFYNKYKSVEKNQIGEVEILLKTISQFMELPDEIPTLATVTDKSKLGDQLFFKNAVNGDKVIIFTTASKAILYRPETKKIIEVSNLAVVDNASVSSQISPTETAVNSSGQKTKIITLALYNGTTEAGLAKRVEKEIFGQSESFKVTTIKDAQKNDYEKTLVIDVSGKNEELAKALAESILGSISPMPLGESTPNTDILIILGKDHP